MAHGIILRSMGTRLELSTTNLRDTMAHMKMTETHMRYRKSLKKEMNHIELDDLCKSRLFHHTANGWNHKPIYSSSLDLTL